MASAALAKLEQFTLAGVEGLNERREKGRGCYGAVYAVQLNGVPCIAKRLHDILVGRGQEAPVREEDRRVLISRFREECVLLSGLRHPNVVQMMGVHFGDDKTDISLIMEYMHMDLKHCIETYPDISLPYKTSILRDVAYGLSYLHSLNIIHRDLNVGNILLTESLRAKIADLGVAKLFDRETAMIQTRTVCPGAQDFMPPECLDESPKYEAPLDVFSFGHLTICLVNQQAPVVTDRTVTVADVQKKKMQVGKRRRALNQMSHQLGGSHHPLYSTVVQCLSDTPDRRPTSRDLVKRMEEICKQHLIPHKNTLQTLAELSMLREEVAAKDRKIVNLMARMKVMDHEPKTSPKVQGIGLRKHLPIRSMAPVCGLQNLGNQCYMNASLQCLSHTHLLRDIFWKPKCAKKKFPTDDMSSYSNVTFIPTQTDRKYGQTQKLVEAFETLQRSMWNDQRSIVNSLKNIKARVASLNSQFAGYSQEDAQKFLTCLLDGLHEGMNGVKKKKYGSMSIENAESWTDEAMADELWRRHLIRNKSMIVELFQGQIKSVLKCLNCTEEVKTFEPIMQLTLPVPPEETFNSMSYQHLTLYHCLNLYTKQTPLTGFCERCLTNTDNEQKFDIWKLPPILVIHLKRFSVSIRNGHKKVTRNVLYPSTRLDLSKYVIGCHPGNAIYELYSVINHYGMLYAAGHYTAFVKESDVWYCCDDSSCYEVPPRDVYENSSAYVLFYKREQRRRRPSI